MSESKVTLPEPYAWSHEESRRCSRTKRPDWKLACPLFTKEQLMDYGYARAAEARRLALDVDKVQAFERNVRADERRKALLEAAALCDEIARDTNPNVPGPFSAIDCATRLRALADDLDMSRPAKAQSPARPPAGQ